VAGIAGVPADTGMTMVPAGQRPIAAAMRDFELLNITFIKKLLNVILLKKLLNRISRQAKSPDSPTIS